MTTPSARLLDIVDGLTAPGRIDRARAETAVLTHLRDQVPGVVSASVTRGPRHRPVTVVRTDALAERADRAQYETGEGPCLHALTCDDAVTVDLVGGAGDGRWPAFRRRVAAEPGIGGVHSRPLRVDETPASLNVYLGVPSPDAEVVATAAAVACLALAAVATRARADQLADALASSRTIGAAIGVLMARHGWTQDVAFTALRHASQHANRKLRDVAADVVTTGEVPSP